MAINLCRCKGGTTFKQNLEFLLKDCSVAVVAENIHVDILERKFKRFVPLTHIIS